MPPQERSPILSAEALALEKRRQEETIANAIAKQKEQQDRWDNEKKAKEEARKERLAQIQKEAEEVRENRRLKNLGMPHIKPFDPEKDGKDGKSIAGNQGEEN